MKKILLLCLGVLVFYGTAAADDIVFEKRNNAFLIHQHHGNTIIFVHALLIPAITSYHLLRSGSTYELTIVTSEAVLGTEELAAGYKQYRFSDLSEKEAKRALRELEAVFLFTQQAEGS